MGIDLPEVDTSNHGTMHLKDCGPDALVTHLESIVSLPVARNHDMQIPTRFISKCEICGNELDNRWPGVCQYTSGWVAQRTKGGGNAVRMPKRENRWAHADCVKRREEGFL